MADNFDLKKFLKESKSIENLNPSVKSINENEYYKDAEADDAEHIKALEKDMKDDKRSSMKSKIRDMIIKELELDVNDPGKTDAEEQNAYDPLYEDEDLDEAKKKDEEVEDVETTDVETTDTTEEVPAEEAPADGGGLEDVAANMQGTEGELMDHLMSAFKIAKGMGNEKLETQVGNTLKFFVSEYIGGGNE
jgi:hypothetical protein